MSDFLKDMSKLFNWVSHGSKKFKSGRVSGFFGWVYKHMKR